jgi:hypothetical protein
MIEHMANIQDSLRHSKHLHCIYIDFKKAYDSVEHNALLNALRSYGFDPQVCELIMTLIKDTRMSMKTSVGPSDTFEVSRGVRQGDIISPTLFLIFINPLIEKINQLNKGYRRQNGKRKNSNFYADDGTIFTETHDNMKLVFQVVIDFCQANNIDMNVKKTAYAYNGYDAPLPDIFDTKSGKPIENIGDRIPYRYLGWLVRLDGKMTELHKEISTTYK